MLIAISGHDRFLAVFLPESGKSVARQDKMIYLTQLSFTRHMG